MRLGQLLYALFLVGLVMLGGPILRARAAEIAWRTDYYAALREAKDAGRCLLAQITAENCRYCTQMDATTFRDPAVVRIVAERFVAVKLPKRTNAELAGACKVRSFPTTFLAGPDGTILETLVGFQDATRFRDALNRCPPIRPRKPPPRGETEKVDPYGTAIVGSCEPGKCSCTECWCAHTGQSCQATGKPCLPMGLDPSKLADRPQTWHGTVATPEEPSYGADVPGLSHLPFGTVVSASKELREKILAEINAAPVGRLCRWQARAPDTWDVEGFHFAQDEKFRASDVCIVVQAPPDKPGGFGKVIGAPDYSWSGADALGRKLDPNFKMPDRPIPSFPAGGVHPLALIAVGCLVLLFLPARKPAPPPLTDVEETDV